MDTNVTMQEPALPLPAGDNIPAVRKNDGKHVLTYAGNELFFGTEARKYWVHNAGTDPWAAGAERFAVYEHAVESRPFAIAVTPLFQKTWVHIGAASTAPDAFLARAAAHTSKATAAEFLAGPQDCGRYELEPVAKILTNTTMAAVSAPAPLSFFRAAMITPADFKRQKEHVHHAEASPSKTRRRGGRHSSTTLSRRAPSSSSRTRTTRSTTGPAAESCRPRSPSSFPTTPTASSSAAPAWPPPPPPPR